MPPNLPHQGVVDLIVSLTTLAITLGILTFILRREKQYQASNTDEH